MSAGHTPGPLVPILAGTMPGGIRMWWLKFGEISVGCSNKADALLYASAPEMFVALKDCADDLEAELRDRWGDDPRLAHKLERDLAPVHAARAAIARALGTTPNDGENNAR